MDKITASLLLHALGDTIGYKNGEWEFNHGRKLMTSSYTLELLYEFIDLGGINHINLKGWDVSDDTVMSIAVIQAFLRPYNTLDDIGRNLVKEFLDIYAEMSENPRLRMPGIALMKYLKMLKNGSSWKDIPYDSEAGGSGASMRTSCIGLMFSGSDNREKLIQYSIEASRITHNNTIGYLGGLVSALFTAYAIEKKPIKSWAISLLKLLDSGVIDAYIIKIGRNVKEYTDDKHVFISKWKKYVSIKFDSGGNIIIRKTDKNLIFRGDYYMSNYGYKIKNTEMGEYAKSNAFIGSGGDDSCIIAYDCLLDSENNWEKLVIYAMLHIGDTDTTGCIAGAWYGAYYGMNNVPKHLFDHLEFKSHLIDLGKKINNHLFK